MRHTLLIFTILLESILLLEGSGCCMAQNINQSNLRRRVIETPGDVTLHSPDKASAINSSINCATLTIDAKVVTLKRLTVNCTKFRLVGSVEKIKVGRRARIRCDDFETAGKIAVLRKSRVWPWKGDLVITFKNATGTQDFSIANAKGLKIDFVRIPPPPPIIPCP